MTAFSAIFFIFFCCYAFILKTESLVVSRNYLDVFDNPNLSTCERDLNYCKSRRAKCFGADCCRCRCDLEYSTFHSPGLKYKIKDGKPSYNFSAKESCVWNHYAHEGCRFVEEALSTSSRKFIPLINLNKNGTVHMKVFLHGVYQCHKYKVFSKRPQEHDWVRLEENEKIFNTSWSEFTNIYLTLKWQKQGDHYGGLMLKLNFTCESALKETREPCIILKIRGTYDTQKNTSTAYIPTQVSTKKTSTFKSEVKTTTEASRVNVKEDTTSRSKLQSTVATNILSEEGTKPALKAIVAVDKKSTPENKMTPTRRVRPLGEADHAEHSHENRGDTFWILVYVFMAFAIFEVFCVVLFFVCKHRKKRKERDSARSEPSSNYDNHGMPEVQTSAINPPPAYQENIQLYGIEMNESRYNSIQQTQNSQNRNGSISMMENGVPANTMLPEQRSRQGSHHSQARSIIVLPQDCVIVHASGSRKSRNSTHGESTSSTPRRKTSTQNEPQNNTRLEDDNRSLYSWESFSSCYRTSTDEDYVSGSNRVNWEEESLYEEPDKVIARKSFGLETLFSMQESVINNVEPSNDSNASNANEGSNGTLVNTKQGSISDEHIYESAEGESVGGRDSSYYENAYDLPEDALAKCLGKPNKFALKHVLHEENCVENEKLNLGMEFVNNDETTDECEDVKLRPTRRSTLYLNQLEDEKNNRASVC